MRVLSFPVFSVIAIFVVVSAVAWVLTTRYRNPPNTAELGVAK